MSKDLEFLQNSAVDNKCEVFVRFEPQAPGGKLNLLER